MDRAHDLASTHPALRLFLELESRLQDFNRKHVKEVRVRKPGLEPESVVMDVIVDAMRQVGVADQIPCVRDHVKVQHGEEDYYTRPATEADIVAMSSLRVVQPRYVLMGMLESAYQIGLVSLPCFL